MPTVQAFRYVKTRDEIDTTEHKPSVLANRYAGVIAQLALLTLHDVFTATSPELVEEVAVNCQLDTIDHATGRQERRCLLSVSATREEFDGLVLGQVEPVDCLHQLNALISPNPWDVEAVRPLFTPDLNKFRFIDAHEVAAHLDSRTVLMKQSPTQFEHLVRELFEQMGMESWVTQASRDDGVDAVALNRDPVVGGLCVIQAKRYMNVVGADAVRALWGVIEDKKAGTGILVTTSYFGKATHEFAQRMERVRLIEGPQLKHLISEHLGIDVLLGAKAVLGLVGTAVAVGIERSGPRADGTAVTPVGFLVSPAGRQSDLGDLPLDAVRSPDGRQLVVSNDGQATQSLQVVVTASAQS